MVYLPCDFTTILSSLHLWRKKQKTCYSHTKDLEASFFLVNEVEASVSHKMRITAIQPRQFSWSTYLLSVVRPWEFTYDMLLFIHVLFKHYIPTGLILSGEYSGGLCLLENENQPLSRAVFMVYLSSNYSTVVGVYICDAPIQTRAVQTQNTYRPHYFWWIHWRPLSLRKWESAI